MTREPLPMELEHWLNKFGLGKLPREQALLMRYDAGEYLSHEGVMLEYIQFIIEGRAKISVSSPQGKTLLFCFDTVGDMIGSIELFSDSHATANAECVVPIKTIAVPIDANLDFFRSDVDFLYHLNRDLSFAFAASSHSSAGNVLYSLQNRLCSYILMMQLEGTFRDKLVDTAELLGTSYRHLLRELSRLCELGVLEKAGRDYRVLQPDALEELGGGYYLSPRQGGKR